MGTVSLQGRRVKELVGLSSQGFHLVILPLAIHTTLLPPEAACVNTNWVKETFCCHFNLYLHCTSTSVLTFPPLLSILSTCSYYVFPLALIPLTLLLTLFLFLPSLLSVHYYGNCYTAVCQRRFDGMLQTQAFRRKQLDLVKVAGGYFLSSSP